MTPASLSIRLARIRDFEQLGILYQQLNPEDPVFSEHELNELENILTTSHLKLIVAAQGQKLLGTCYLNLIPNLSRGAQAYALIENVIVDEAHRRQGIGRALIQKAITLARDAGCYKLMLLSGRKNETVENFYENCGFDQDAKQAYILRFENAIHG